MAIDHSNGDFTFCSSELCKKCKIHIWLVISSTADAWIDMKKWQKVLLAAFQWIVNENHYIKLLHNYNYAASTWLAYLTLSIQTPTLQHYSTYSEKDLLPCLRKMAWLVVNMNSAKQQAVKTKYSSSRFQRVAKAAVLQRQTIMDLAKAAAH